MGDFAEMWKKHARKEAELNANEGNWRSSQLKCYDDVVGAASKLFI